MSATDTTLPDDLRAEIVEINNGLREVILPFLADLATRTSATVDRMIPLHRAMSLSDEEARARDEEDGVAELHELFSLVRGLSDPVGQGKPYDWYFYELAQKYGLTVPKHRHIP